MPTPLRIPAPPGSGIDGTITLTIDGASPRDDGPAGILARMIIAQCAGDEHALRALVTARTMEMGKPKPPGQIIHVRIEPAQFEGEIAVVPAELEVDGSKQAMPFVLMKEAGSKEWRVDMQASMEKMMGGSLEELTALEKGMEQMAGQMREVMEGLGEAMGEAFKATGPEGGEEKPEESAPAKAKRRRERGKGGGERGG